MISSSPIIGLVGGVGSGKSTVAAMLRDLGCVVADSDLFAREALRDPEIRKNITAWWGSDVLDPRSGEVDRGRIAAIVFADREQRKRLESLTHPWIERKRRELFESHTQAKPPAFVIDAPLLLEAGLAAECDAVIFIDAPADMRERRVQERSHWTHDQWRSREAAQLPLDEKRRRADHVIVNSGDLNGLRAAVARTLAEIAANSKRRDTTTRNQPEK